MIRKYTLFSIDDSRKHLTQKVRQTLNSQGWSEVQTNCISAYVPGQVEAELERRGLFVNPIDNDPRTIGEIAIWLTVLNGIEHAPVVTIEDDAIIGENFTKDFDEAMSELPDDVDFFSLFIPRDSDHLFTESYSMGKSRACRAYQRYGGVSMYVSAAGAEKILSLVQRDGITAQWDNELYRQARQGALNGYTSMPTKRDIVWINSETPTIVHDTELF